MKNSHQSQKNKEIKMDSRNHEKYETSRTVQNRGIDETQTNVIGRNRFESSQKCRSDTSNGKCCSSADIGRPVSDEEDPVPV